MKISSFSQPQQFQLPGAEEHIADPARHLNRYGEGGFERLSSVAWGSNDGSQAAGEADWRAPVDAPAKIERHTGRRERLTTLASPEEIISEAREGRMFILVDDEDRENEGDLIIPVQMATPNAINFMATHGRGLICLALTRSRVDELGLSPTTRKNTSPHETAFTVSIEAKEGVSTGISAADRALTISVAINRASGPSSIVSPGHIFALVAKEGGVLVRAGHTEAAVDVARLAGLNPAGVICEIMNDDGTMARLTDLIPFAGKHGLKIGTIRDLIAYRRLHDHLVEKQSEVAFTSRWGGDWQALTFIEKATGSTHVVLQKGSVNAGRPTLVKMHRVSPVSDILGGLELRSDRLSRGWKSLASKARGSWFSLTLGARTRWLGWEFGPAEPEREQSRNYGVGVQILAALGIENMVLLTNSGRSLVAIDGHDLSVVVKRQADAGSLVA